MINLLRQREVDSSFNYKRKIRRLLEESFAHGCHQEEYYDLNSASVTSTIAIDISTNGEYLASSHGDHTVKVFIYKSGKQFRNFHGHPRTPWTVKFNPKDSNIVASGCLGFEARVWNIELSVCLNVIKYDFSIITMSFHPSGELLAVASGQILRLWNWKKLNRLSASLLNPVAVKNLKEQDEKYKSHDYYTRGVLHDRSIRAVVFHPSGEYLFVAAPYLKREDSKRHISAIMGLTPCRLYCVNYRDMFDDLPKRLLDLQAQPIVLSEMHVYSDGGIDLSKDGKYLVVCGLLLAPLSSESNTSMSLKGLARSDYSSFHTVNKGEDQWKTYSSLMRSIRSPYKSTTDERNESLTSGWLSNNNVGMEASNINQSNAILNDNSLGRYPPLLSGDAMARSNMNPTSDNISTSFQQLLQLQHPNQLKNDPAPDNDDTLQYHYRPSMPLYPSAPSNPLFEASLQPIPITSGNANPSPHISGYTLKEHICVFELAIDKVSQSEFTNYMSIPLPPPPPSTSSSYRLPPGKLDVSNLSANLSRVEAQAQLSQGNRAMSQRSSAMNSSGHFYQSDSSVGAISRTPRAVAYDDDIGDDHEYVESFVVSTQEVYVRLAHYKSLSSSLMKAIVSTKFSSTGDYIVLGFGVRNEDKEVVGHSHPRVACEVLDTNTRDLESVAVFSHTEDEVNVSLFHPSPGYGLVYGTKSGRLRVFRRGDDSRNDDDAVTAKEDVGDHISHSNKPQKHMSKVWGLFNVKGRSNIS